MEIEKGISQLRRFLVSKVISCCQVMITMQQLVLPLNPHLVKYIQRRKVYPSAKCNIIEVDDGLFFLVSISIVDTDPKPSSRIKKNINKYHEIRDWWTNVSQAYTH